MKRILDVWPLCLLWTLLVLAVLLASCKRSPAPPPATQPAPAAVFVGGLNKDQTGDIAAGIAAAAPGVQVVSFGVDNGWMGDVKGWGARSNYTYAAIISHSFGCWRVSVDAPQMRDVKLIVMLDPVAYGLGNQDIYLPAGVPVYVYRATDHSGVNPARVHGRFFEVTVEGTHSSICHDPSTVAEVTDLVKRSLQ